MASQMRTGNRYGTHPDLPDHRDLVFESGPTLQRLPASVDHRPRCPPVYHQETLNACSANAIAAAMAFAGIAGRGISAPSPSRLFIYFNERARERKIGRNVPVSLRDGYRTVARQGVCSEEMWPYLVKRFGDRPDDACYRAAKKFRVVSYARIHRDLAAMKACLAGGYPFTAGISVHESFEGPAIRDTGRGEMPRRGERLLGGHAVLVVGYHDRDQRFILRNSWGASWGLAGYFTLPYEFLLHPNYGWDFWTVHGVTSEVS